MNPIHPPPIETKSAPAVQDRGRKQVICSTSTIPATRSKSSPVIRNDRGQIVGYTMAYLQLYWRYRWPEDFK